MQLHDWRSLVWEKKNETDNTLSRKFLRKFPKRTPKPAKQENVLEMYQAEFKKICAACVIGISKSSIAFQSAVINEDIF